MMHRGRHAHEFFEKILFYAWAKWWIPYKIKSTHLEYCSICALELTNGIFSRLPLLEMNSLYINLINEDYF